MEAMEIEQLFDGLYKNKTVLITGHSGFKGSWLALWLHHLGAKVVGYSLGAPTVPSHAALLQLPIPSVTGDIRRKEDLEKTLSTYRPDMVFHMAAQPLVRYSYKHPHETFETNAMGTVNLLEAIRKTGIVKAVINVTTDKCYENKEQRHGYCENDPLGGHDPYSASKACSELVSSAYRSSFFSGNENGASGALLLATARAGNVVGGGDWAGDRLVPDVMRAVSQGQSVLIRNPNAARPWQHVLEPLSGYLHLGWKLLQGNRSYAEAWNFGPAEKTAIPVAEVLSLLKNEWPAIRYQVAEDPAPLHETQMLPLDCAKANRKLDWHPVWTVEQGFKRTAAWYKNYYEAHRLNSLEDLKDYVRDAREKKIAWAA